MNSGKLHDTNSIQNSVAFLYINKDRSEREMKKIMQFKIGLKNNKMSRNKLSQRENPCSEDYKTSVRHFCELRGFTVSTLCDPMCHGPPDSSVHGMSQARTLEWTVIPYSRVSSWPRDRTLIFCIAGGFFYSWATRETQKQFKMT